VETAYPFEVAGLLFFHHECRYTPGVTPLALWLTPELLEERLGISVPPLPPPIQPVLPAVDEHMHGVIGGEPMDEIPNGDVAVGDSTDLGEFDEAEMAFAQLDGGVLAGVEGGAPEMEEDEGVS
jgi:hypothetical protein